MIEIIYVFYSMGKNSYLMNYYEIDTTLNCGMFRLICSIGFSDKFYLEKHVGQSVDKSSCLVKQWSVK